MLEPGLPVARTPLYHWHAAHGARFVDRDGWQVVAAYTRAEDEAKAARAGLGLADITSLAIDNAENATPGDLDHAAFWLLGPRLDKVLGSLTHLDLGPASLSALSTDFSGTGRQGEPQTKRPRIHTVSSDGRGGDGNWKVETVFAGVEARLTFPSAPSLPSLQIHVAWDVGEYVWQRVLDAGWDLPIVPLGWDALHLLGAMLQT
jgi:hypothetical protein